jgi:hypothetical protein
MRISLASKRAVSLAEVVITIVLLAIVVLSCFNYYANVVSFSIKAENYNAATEFLAETLEKILSYSYDDSLLSVTEGQAPPGDRHNDPLPGSIFTRWYTVSSERRWDPAQADSLYKEVVATISWDDGTPRQLVLSLRKTK